MKVKEWAKCAGGEPQDELSKTLPNTFGGKVRGKVKVNFIFIDLFYGYIMVMQGF